MARISSNTTLNEERTKTYKLAIILIVLYKTTDCHVSYSFINKWKYLKNGARDMVTRYTNEKLIDCIVIDTLSYL